MDYREIEPRSRIVDEDVFAGESAQAVAGMPKQLFTTSFIDEGATTRVVVVVSYEKAEDLQTMLEMGMTKGVTMAQDQLEDLLASQP